MPAKRAPKAAVKAPAKPKAAAKPTKAKAAAAKPTEAAPAAAAPAAPGAAAAAAAASVHITSSKVCQAFATRVAGLVAAVAVAKPGAKVVVDAQPALGRKPDRGSFVVSVGGANVVELLSMPRPFTAMKALDMADVAKQVIAQL